MLIKAELVMPSAGYKLKRLISDEVRQTHVGHVMAKARSGFGTQMSPPLSKQDKDKQMIVPQRRRLRRGPTDVMAHQPVIHAAFGKTYYVQPQLPVTVLAGRC